MAIVKLPLLMLCSVTSITNPISWTESDGSGDPYVGQPYQWTVNISIPNTQTTGDWSATPVAYSLTGQNVEVGMWIVFTQVAFALQIVSISSQTDNFITCVVEDVDRYNLFFYGQGSGIGPQSNPGVTDVIILELDENGLPMFEGGLAPFVIPVNTQSEVQGRFQQYNYVSNITINQPGQTFSVGDQIILQSNGMYAEALATSASVDSIVGTVVRVNVPGVDYFSYKPVNKLVNISVPGNPGDLIYVSTSVAGGLTNVQPTNYAKPAYIKISSSQAIELDRSRLATVPLTYSFTATSVDQTSFTLPTYINQVVTFAINGIEVDNYSFTAPTLNFNPVAEGYQIDTTDSLKVLYTSY